MLKSRVFPRWKQTTWYNYTVTTNMSIMNTKKIIRYQFYRLCRREHQKLSIEWCLSLVLKRSDITKKTQKKQRYNQNPDKESAQHMRKTHVYCLCLILETLGLCHCSRHSPTKPYYCLLCKLYSPYFYHGGWDIHSRKSSSVRRIELILRSFKFTFCCAQSVSPKWSCNIWTSINYCCL